MPDRYLATPAIMDVAKYFYSVPWLWRRIFAPSRSFSFDGRDYAYFSHPYNATWRNERAIEIPLLLPHLDACQPGDVLEVGNVLSHYVSVQHPVVDKYEHGPGVIAEDIVDLELSRRFQRIVSISTLEHIGWDESPRVPGKHLRAVASARRLLAPDGQMLATIPLGYNPHLDEDLFAGRLGCARVAYFKRLSVCEWRTSSAVEAGAASYGKKFRTTDGLALCIWDAGPPGIRR